MDDGSDPRGALVYAEAVRTLESQSRQLDEIRSRAGILLAASSITTSFLAQLVLADGDDNLSILSVLAGLTFLYVLWQCVRLLYPRGEWRFRMAGVKSIAVVLDARPQPSLTRTHRGLAKQMDGWAWENEVQLKEMLQWFSRACVALGIEVIFWCADLVVRRWT